MGFTVTRHRARSGGCGERERREVGEKEEARVASARSRAVGEARPWGSGAGLPALALGVLGAWRRCERVEGDVAGSGDRRLGFGCSWNKWGVGVGCLGRPGGQLASWPGGGGVLSFILFLLFT